MICKQCGQDKVAGAFYWHSNGCIAWGQRCRLCCKRNRENSEYKSKAWLRNLKSKYNISGLEYQVLFEKQQGKCAICGKSSAQETGLRTKLSIDHDHKTNKIRGLLCHACNAAIGFLCEDSDRIYKVLDYLSLHGIKVEEEE